ASPPQFPPARPPLPGAFYVASLANLLFALGVTLLVPIIALFITDELRADEQWIGTATLYMSFSAIATRIPGGVLSDRYGRRRVMLIGAVFGILAAAVYTASHSLPVFLAARLMSGASLALFTTANKALSADLAPAARRGEAMGINNAAFALALVLSPVLSEGLKNAISFQIVFAVSGGLILLALAVTYRLPDRAPERTAAGEALGDVQTTLRQRGVWAAIVLMLSLGAILTLMYTFYPLLAERRALYLDAPPVFSTVAMGIGLSIWALTDTLVEPIAGRLSDRVGRQQVALPGLVLAALGVIAMSEARGTLSAYLAVAVLSTGWGATHAVADALSQDAVPPPLRGMSAAVVYTAFDLAVGANAQVLAGLIDGSDFSVLFHATTAVVLAFGLTGILLATRLATYEERAAYPAPPLIGD
ncbi:MAG TPA: MFS transporter, partial [Aggregatilineales bacterium]|nr:MFS transporter [Aggregatilineales bacterium]